MNIFKKKKDKKPNVSNPDINRSLISAQHSFGEQSPTGSAGTPNAFQNREVPLENFVPDRNTKAARMEIKENYDWDFCIVVPNPDHEEFKKHHVHADFKPHSEILERLHLAELETYQFYSSDMDEIFIKIRAPLAVLRRHAQNMQFKMLLDSNYIKRHIENIKEPIGMDPNHTNISPYDYIYASYDDSKCIRLHQFHYFLSMFKPMLCIFHSHSEKTNVFQSWWPGASVFQPSSHQIDHGYYHER
jgi:hypothetical protein